MRVPQRLRSLSGPKPPNRYLSALSSRERSCLLPALLILSCQLARPNPRIVIALRSPSALAETGLPMCLAEKCQTVTAFDAEQSVLCSPVCLGLIAKYGHYSGILVESKREFSAIKTEWRRGRDSNPRYLFGYAGLSLQ